MMDFITGNWLIILIVVMVMVATAYYIIYWVKLPTLEKKEKLKAWMEWAVTLAEKELGKQTGQAKLRYVWDLFSKSKFGWLSKIITFEHFSAWVDEALKWLNLQIKTNESFYKYVYGNDSSIVEEEDE